MAKIKTVQCPHCEGTGRRADPLSQGEQLRRRRLEAGYGLRRLAELLECSPTHVSDIELGKRRPSPGLLRKYKEIVGG